MMTIINVCVCVTFCIILAFWVGKKIGRSRIFKLEKQMVEYENRLNTMQAGFDKVVDFYIKDLENHTEEIKELLTVADKKCLYAHDLLAELDKSLETIKRRNLSGDAIAVAAQAESEKISNLKQDFKTAIDEIHERLDAVSKSVTDLKSAASQASNIDEEEVKAIVNNELSVYLEALGLDSANDSSAAPDLPVKDNNSDSSSYTFISNETMENHNSIRNDSIMVDPVSSAEVFAADRVNHGLTKEREKEIINRIAKKDISYIRQEALKLYADRMAVPQIAREMKLGVGEVQMIVNLYGSRAGLRR